MSRGRLFFLFTKYVKIRVNSVNLWFFTEDGRTRTDEKRSNLGWLGGVVSKERAAATWTARDNSHSRRNAAARWRLTD